MLFWYFRDKHETQEDCNEEMETTNHETIPKAQHFFGLTYHNVVIWLRVQSVHIAVCCLELFTTHGVKMLNPELRPADVLI